MTVIECQAPAARKEHPPARPPLTTVQVIEQVIARDMSGDPGWKLTNAARQWFAAIVRQLDNDID